MDCNLTIISPEAKTINNCLSLNPPYDNGVVEVIT